MAATEGGFTSDISRLRTTCERLRACCELNEKLLSVPTLDEAVPLLVSHVTEALGGTSGVLVRVDSSACAELPEQRTADAPWRNLPDGARARIIETVSRDRRPFLVLDAARMLDLGPRADVPPVKCLIAVPVVVEADELGVLVIFDFPEPADTAAYVHEAALLAAALSRMFGHVRILEMRGRQNRLMEAILENTHNAIVYLDREFRIVQLNAAFAECCHQPREALLGKSLLDRFPADRYLRFFEAARDSGETQSLHEVPYALPNQPERDVTYWDARIRPIKDDNGWVEGVVLSVTDLTEEVRSKQELRQAQEAQARETRFLEAILENSTSPVAYFDTDFSVVRANSAAAAAVKLSREQIIGRHILEFFPESESEKFMQVRRLGKPLSGHETPSSLMIDADHPDQYWDWSLVPVKDARGEVEGLVLSAMDVTEQVETRERLVAAERTKTEVAATLAQEIDHRVKNDILLLIGLLKRQKDTLPARSYAAEVLQIAMTRLMTIATVHEHLYLRRGQSLNVLDAVKQIADAARESLAREHVQMSIAGAPVEYGPQPGSAMCVMANELITNAIKHGCPLASGELKIEVELWRQGGTLRLSVWNSGNPLPQGFDMEAHKVSGLSIIDALAVNQYGGSFVLRAERGGTLAEVTMSDSKLRE